MNVLIPVQPGHDTGWISDYLSELRRNDPALMAYVLSVQPGYDGCVRMFFNKGQLFQFHCEDARAQSAALCESLAARGIQYRMFMEVGRTAERIAFFAREWGCRHIVIGPRSRTSLVDFLFGSVKRDVETLLKGPGLSYTVR